MLTTLLLLYMNIRYVDHNKLRKIFQEMRIPDHLICLLRNLFVGQEAIVSIIMELTGSKLRSEYDKAVYCLSSYTMLTWMNHKL